MMSSPDPPHPPHPPDPPDPPDPVGEAWEASSLSRATVGRFYQRIEQHEVEPDPIGPLATTGPQVPLEPVDDRLQRYLDRRRSTKVFGPESLTERSVARVLAAVGPAGPQDRSGPRRGLGRIAPGRLTERPPAGAHARVVPSPGGLQTVNAYLVGANVDGPLAGRIARYDHRRHEVAILGPAPPADQLRSLFSLDCDGEPQLLLAWIVDPRQAIARYGARALRLVLQEVGHAAQNVALRLAADGLAGYPLGAVLDREVLALLGLGALDLWVAGGFACGRPPTSSG